MAAGYTYVLTPQEEVEERYSVKTGRRRINGYVLNTTNLNVGDVLPSFAPVCADLGKKTAVVVRNFKVCEAYTTSETALSIKVAKSPLPYVGMFIGNGTNGANVSGVDKSNANYDLLTIGAAFGANLAIGDVLFEATAAGGKNQKNIANSALYGRWKIDSGINVITLLRAAAEIEPTKLSIPFSANDKAVMTAFQFNE